MKFIYLKHTKYSIIVVVIQFYHNNNIIVIIIIIIIQGHVPWMAGKIS